MPQWFETKGFVEYKRLSTIRVNSDRMYAVSLVCLELGCVLMFAFRVQTVYLEYNVLDEANSSDDSDSAGNYGDDEEEHGDSSSSSGSHSDSA